MEWFSNSRQLAVHDGGKTTVNFSQTHSLIAIHRFYPVADANGKEEELEISATVVGIMRRIRRVLKATTTPFNAFIAPDFVSNAEDFISRRFLV